MPIYICKHLAETNFQTFLISGILPVKKFPLPARRKFINITTCIEEFSTANNSKDGVLQCAPFADLAVKGKI